jgi:DNA-binding IclR family transcriptional regulator
MSDKKYLMAAQQRVLQTLVKLAGHEIEGLAPGEIAKAIRTTPSNTTRDLANLRESGLAESMESGRWRLTPRMAQIGLSVMKALDNAQSRVDETRQRFTREFR